MISWALWEDCSGYIEWMWGVPLRKELIYSNKCWADWAKRWEGPELSSGRGGGESRREREPRRRRIDATSQVEEQGWPPGFWLGQPHVLRSLAKPEGKIGSWEGDQFLFWTMYSFEGWQADLEAEIWSSGEVSELRMQVWNQKRGTHACRWVTAREHLKARGAETELM